MTLLNYGQGQVYFTEEQGASKVISGNYAVKDFNVYLTNDTEDDLIVENKYEVNSRLPSGPLTYIQPYDDVVPAAFLSIAQGENKPFAFGGMVETQIQAKAVILADNPYQLDGVLSIFMDSVNESIVPIPMSGYPITELGDLKGDSYSYTTAKNPYTGEMVMYVDKVKTSKLSDRTRNVLANELYVGFIDFDIEKARLRFS